MRALCNSKPCFFICGSNHACGGSHILNEAKEAVDAKIKASIGAHGLVCCACAVRQSVRVSSPRFFTSFVAAALQAGYYTPVFFFLIFSQVFDRGERKEMNTDRQASIPVPDDGTSSKQTPCGSAETKTVLHRTGHYSFYILE